MTDDRTIPSPATEGQETTAQEAVVSPPAPEGTEPDTAGAPEREPVEVDIDELLGKAQERDEYLALHSAPRRTSRTSADA